MQGITLREGTLADIPTIALHRRRMCEDMNYSDTSALSTMVTVTTEYLKKAIPEGSFRSWLACDDGKVVAGGAVVIVYTDPEYRRRGIAREIMHAMIAWCKQQGFARVTLHASEHGRHLYESLGFELNN